jgi:hypothetical protein
VIFPRFDESDDDGNGVGVGVGVGVGGSGTVDEVEELQLIGRLCVCCFSSLALCLSRANGNVIS